MALSQLERLEAEAIHIMREAVAEAERPVMLYSIGKDSSVMLRLALKAFHPGPPPFPLLHVDTTWKFRDMVLFRDRMAREHGLDLRVFVNPAGAQNNISPFTHGPAVHTEVMETQALKLALDQYGFDVAFGGARRDEEKARAQERIFSLRCAQHRRDPKDQRPELWRLYNTRKRRGESLRVFPLSNWTELDVWEYIRVENIPVVPLYFAKPRPVVERDGALIMVDDARMPLRPGETPAMRKVRFRTLGCYPLTAAIESSAETLPEIIQELRQSRADAPPLRLLMCGGAQDGKSTLVGRLLHESKQIFDHQLAALAADDVAYRFFCTARRKVIVADAPGNERYTRNMVSGASTADAAVIVVDARKGIVTQTRRHAYLVSQLGVRHAVLAVNKMDLAGYSEARFREIEADCAGLAQRLGLMPLAAIPLSALTGENLVAAGGRMPWYRGPTLMAFIDAVSVDEDRLQSLPFRLPVQWVNRPNRDFRGYCGTVASGVVRAGERVRIHPSGRESTVARIVSRDGDRPQAVAGQSVTLTLADEIDVARGDVMVRADSPAGVADQFEATVIWMDEEPMLGGRPYLMKIGSATALATPAAPKYRFDVDTLEHLAAKKLELNDIGVCNLSLDRPVAFDPYAENREMGGFILIDRLSHRTFGAGLLHFALRRADNIQVQALDVDHAARAGLMGQRSCVIWLTGLPAAGKSTLANLVDSRLVAMGRHTYLLDGDNVRHGLCRDLGFTDADRVENVRRVAEVAKLMADAGLIVIASLISPYRSDRRMARELVRKGEFIEVFVDTPLAVAEQRDPKGLYRKARRGEVKNFTGIDAPYEAPENPELRIETVALSPQEGAEQVLRYLAGCGVIPSRG